MSIVCFVYDSEATGVLKSQGHEPEDLCLSTEREVFKVLGEPKHRMSMEQVQAHLNSAYNGQEVFILTWG